LCRPRAERPFLWETGRSGLQGRGDTKTMICRSPVPSTVPFYAVHTYIITFYHCHSFSDPSRGRREVEVGGMLYLYLFLYSFVYLKETVSLR
jgi:hypothetical protein